MTRVLLKCREFHPQQFHATAILYVGAQALSFPMKDSAVSYQVLTETVIPGFAAMARAMGWGFRTDFQHSPTRRAALAQG